MKEIKEFSATVIESHPWVKSVLWLVGICIAFMLINFVVNALTDRLSERGKLRFKLYKSIVFAIAIPLVGVYIWYNYSETPFNEYQLITDSKIAHGYITKTEQDSDIAEYNDGRSAAMVYTYYYGYTFTLPNGEKVNSFGEEDGYIPDYLSEVSNDPYPVEVEYLKRNPQVNRVKGMPSNHTSIYQWFRFTILMGVLVLVTCSFFSYLIIKKAKSGYKIEVKSLTKKLTATI